MRLCHADAWQVFDLLSRGRFFSGSVTRGHRPQDWWRAFSVSQRLTAHSAWQGHDSNSLASDNHSSNAGVYQNPACKGRQFNQDKPQ
jgi:hypothetical protein